MKDLSVSTIVAIYIIAAFSACRSDDDDWKYDPSVPIGELQEEIKDLIRPDYLQAGDSVAIFGISNHTEPTELTEGIAMLESWGLKVKLAKNLYKQNGRYDGTLEERIAATQELLDNPNIKAMIASRGGYGATQVVGKLDFTKFMKNPKWVVGYSDITAFHIVLNNLGVESIHGTMMNKMSDAVTVQSLHDALFGTRSGITINTNSNCLTGEAEGRLVGGNLSLIYSMEGTVLDLNTKNAILFIEDTGEANYAIDRMLQSLMLAGKLDNIRGIVVGQFIDTNNSGGRDLPVPDIIKSKLNGRSIPMMYYINVGHDQTNYSLYLGRKIHLKVGGTQSNFEYEN